MKQTIPGLARRIIVAALFLSAVTAIHSQAAIVYSDGSAFALQTPESETGAVPLDLNGDGTADLYFLNFQSSVFLCTADVPASFCTAPFYVAASGANGLLARFGYATILYFGSSISQFPPTNSAWSDAAQTAAVASYFFSARVATNGYGGPLADAGVGYLGVRFYAADGLHYGWVRLRMPPSNEFAPVAVDWAYESQPDTMIAAGLIGASGDSRQLFVTFSEPGGDVGESLGTGSLILTGNRLRCEIILAGAFSSAQIEGPAPVHSLAKPVASLGQPLAVRTDYTAFFRDVVLSHSEAIQFLHGLDQVSIDGGVLVGTSSPLRLRLKSIAAGNFHAP